MNAREAVDLVEQVGRVLVLVGVGIVLLAVLSFVAAMVL